MAGKNEVSIWIRAKDLASGTFKKFERNLNAAWRTTKNVAKGLVALGAAAGAAVVGLGKLSERGGRYLTVSTAFERATLGQANALDRLRQASGGLISRFDLMQQGNQALALGSARSVEEFERMLRISQSLSRSLGIDMSFALESLNTGIARQSRLRLDNLAILVDVGAENKKYAATLGKEVSQLTELEKRDAFRAAALREGERIVAKMGESAGGAGDSWIRFTTAMGDARDEAAVFVAESEQMSDFFAGLEGVIDRLVEKLPGLISNLSAAVSAAESLLLGTNNFKVDTQANIHFRSARAQADRSDDPLMFLALRQNQADADASRLAETLRIQALRIQDNPADRQRARRETGESFLEAAVVTPGEVARFEQLQEEVAVHERLVELLQQEIMLRNQPAGPSGGSGGAGAGGLGLPVPKIGMAGADRTEGRLMQLVAGRSGLSSSPGVRISDFSIPDEVTASYRKGKEGAEDMSRAMIASVAAFEDISMAALGAGRSVEDVLLPSLTSIAMAIPGVGALGSALIGAAGGILGALTRGRDRPRVVVDEYSPRAQRQMQPADSGPRTQFFLGDRELTDEETLRKLGYNLQRRERLLGGSRTGVG